MQVFFCGISDAGSFKGTVSKAATLDHFEPAAQNIHLFVKLYLMVTKGVTND